MKLIVQIKNKRWLYRKLSSQEPLSLILNKLFEFLFNQGLGLKTELIEGDDIYLEYTVAKVVRGNNITIGKGCIIDTIEYKSDLKKIDDGKVENQIKIS